MHLETHLPLLLDLLLKSTAVLALAALLMAAFRRASAANRHALAVAALVSLLVLPFTKLAQPRWSYALNHDAPAAPLTIKLPPIITKTSPEIEMGSALVAPEIAPVKAAGIRVNWSAVGVGVWLAGIALVLLHRAGVGLQLRGLARQSRPVNAGRVLTMAHELAAACGVRAEIRESDTCRVPLAFGVWRPTVLLPGEAMGWSDGRLSAALQHEFGHIRRRDCLTRWFADLACAFYWMNPLAWLGARHLRLAQEQACDDLVLNAGTRTDDYATQLVEVVRSLQGDRFTARHALAMAQPSTLETRVRAIVDENCDHSARSVRGAFAGITFATVALALCTAAQLRGADDRKPATVAEAGPSRAAQIEIATRFIEITDNEPAVAKFLKALNLKATSTLRGIVPAEKADAAVNKLAKAKRVLLLSAPRVTTKPKQRAIIEVIREYRHPTEWEKDAKGNAWKPTTFETKDIGVTFDVTPEVLEDGSISLKMTPQIVEFEGFVDLDGDASEILGKPDASEPARKRLTELPNANAVPAGHRAQPVFRTRKISTEATMQSGQTIVIGGFESPDADDKAKAGGAAPKTRLIVLVTVRGFTREEVNAWQKEAEAKGKIEVQSDEITFDKKTGKLSASGNVKIETAQATITAAAVEIAAKKTGAAAAAEKIIFPKVDFRDATLREVVEFLVAKSRALDPAGKGVNIVIKESDRISEMKITLELTNVPLSEVLRYVASLADLGLREDEFAIFIGKPPAAGDKAAKAENAGGGNAAAQWILPKVDFRDATLREAVDFLVARSKTLDAVGKGVNIVIKDAARIGDAKITLSLADIPLAEVLRYVAALANCEVLKEEFAFVIRPMQAGKPAAPNAETEKGAANASAAPAPEQPGGAAMKKAGAIIFPKIDLRDATLSETVDFLRAKAKNLDPDGQGVNLIVKPQAGGADPRITLSLANIPLSEALRYVAALANYEIVAADKAVILQPPAK